MAVRRLARWLWRRRVCSPLRRRVEQVIEARVRARVLAESRMVPGSETAPEDVFIVGFPKSGHTWFQCLVAGAVYGVRLDYTPYPVIWDLVPAYDWPYYHRHGTPTFFKSHSLPRPEFRRVVYLLRDGRDVMVAQYHHLTVIRRMRGLPTDFGEVIQGRQRISGFEATWSQHVEAWLANPHGADMLVIRYEELQQDVLKQLERFCGFVEIPRPRAWLEQAAEQASFERMQAKEAREGLGKPQWPGFPSWPKGEPFVRRGVPGSHRDEMPPELLAEFLRGAGRTLEKVGYV